MEGKREEQSHLEAGISSDMALVAAAAEATSTADVEVDVVPEEEGRDVAVAVPVAVAAATAEPVTTFNAVVEEGTKEGRLAGVGAPSSVTVTALEAVAAATEAAAEEAAAEKKAREDNEEASICVICLSRLTCCRIGCIPCGHLFCRSCLEIMPQQSCPTCKHMFILEDVINLDACSRLRGLGMQMGQQFHALLKQYGVDLTLKREEHLARLLSELAEEKEKFESTLLIEAKKKLSQHKK